MATELTTKIPIKMGERGFELTTMEDAWRFAVAVIKSGLAPKAFQRPEAVLIALEFGAELGLRPMQSVQSIAVINGRPSLYGDAALALCRQSPDWGGIKEYWENESPGPDFPDNMTAVCEVTNKRDGQPIVSRFSVADAKQAKLWGKRGKDGQDTPWITYPKRMLQMRARSWSLRGAFAHMLSGLLLAEEAADIPPEYALISGTTAPTDDLDALTDTVDAEFEPAKPNNLDELEHVAAEIEKSPFTPDQEAEIQRQLAMGN